MAETWETAEDFFGDKLYQQRAKLILPILVRQATARERISYESLAEELGMTNPRVLNYPLGSVGSALVDLSKSWKAEVPHIQSLVVNKRTGLPGPGFDGFLIEAGYKWADSIEREAVIKEYWAKISAYPYWDDVLSDLNLSRAPNSASRIVAKASTGLGSGEGSEHKRLKEFVRNNPQLFGLPADHPVGQVEYGIASGDRIDVVFSNKNRVVAVEVKPPKAPDFDIARGLFQCVKYRAVLRANAAHQHDTRPITIWLVLGGSLFKELVPLRNTLGIPVMENIAPK